MIQLHKLFHKTLHYVNITCQQSLSSHQYTINQADKPLHRTQYSSRHQLCCYITYFVIWKHSAHFRIFGFVTHKILQLLFLEKWVICSNTDSSNLLTYLLTHLHFHSSTVTMMHSPINIRFYKTGLKSWSMLCLIIMYGQILF